MKDSKQTDKNPANRDPISGAKGSHPIGVGLGAAAGGVAGAGGAAAIGAAVGSVVGPAGTAVGAVVGGLAGAAAGKGIAEAVNPTREDAYWRENHARQPFARQRSYDDFRDAYRLGYESYGRYGQKGRFEDYSEELRQEFERKRGGSSLSWDDARLASQAAWDRLAQSNDISERLIGYSVLDQNDSRIGEVNNLWIDESAQPVFLGVKTGWLFGKNHVVPVFDGQVNNAQRAIRVPYEEAKIKDAPSFDADQEISDIEVQRIFEYYGVSTGIPQSQNPRKDQSSKTVGTNTTEQATVKLHEEELKVGKREVEAGGIRLRKVVRTEIVNQPVELRREEIVVERVPSNASAPSNDEGSFVEEDIFIPLRREEAVVQKESRVREEVRVGKKANIDTQRITDSVRSEDVEIEETSEARR